MEEFEIGQVFDGRYPPKAAQWCNKNNAHIVDITPEGERKSIYRIDANKPPSIEAVKKRYEIAVQNHLDATAQSRGYDNIYTCLSYLNSTDEVWRTEANIFNAWRDAVWRRCHQILNAFMAGEIEQPTVEEVIALLPEIDWDGGVS